MFCFSVEVHKFLCVASIVHCSSQLDSSAAPSIFIGNLSQRLENGQSFECSEVSYVIWIARHSGVGGVETYLQFCLPLFCYALCRKKSVFFFKSNAFPFIFSHLSCY
jgi:hypothetical protein